MLEENFVRIRIWMERTYSLRLAFEGAGAANAGRLAMTAPRKIKEVERRIMIVLKVGVGRIFKKI